MFIVPAEQKIDLRRPPVVTVMLALACLLIFFGYQTGDDERTADAIEVYAGQELISWERELLHSYAIEQGVENFDPEQWQSYLVFVLSPEFDAHVRSQWWQIVPEEEWRVAREKFEAARDRISWVRYGFTPAEFDPLQLMAHMFMHAGLGHLLGNLLFLIIFGIALERVLGPAMFLATYLVTGAMAAGLFALTHSGSHVPLVGASGAISGLMGAYLGVYGLRRIRFFYIIGFWFGQLRAPALLLFPLWLLNELYGHFYVEGGVAYMAHAGGLLAGLGIALLLRRQAADVIEQDEETAQQNRARAEKLQRVRQLLTDLRLEEAARQAQQAVVSQPDEPAYWQLFAEVAWRLPAGAAQQRMLTMLFMNAGKKAMSMDFLRNLLQEYRERYPQQQPALAGKSGAALALRFFREGSMRDVDNLLDALARSGRLPPEFAELLNILLQFAEKNRDRRRADRYRRYLGMARDQPAEGTGV